MRQLPFERGAYIDDVFFRIERIFGVVITREQHLKLLARNDPPDILVSDIFDLILRKVFQVGLFDEEVDGEGALWRKFQELLSNATGVDPDQLRPDHKLVEDLGL